MGRHRSSHVVVVKPRPLRPSSAIPTSTNRLKQLDEDALLLTKVKHRSREYSKGEYETLPLRDKKLSYKAFNNALLLATSNTPRSEQNRSRDLKRGHRKIKTLHSLPRGYQYAFTLSHSPRLFSTSSSLRTSKNTSFIDYRQDVLQPIALRRSKSLFSSPPRVERACFRYMCEV